MKEFSIAKCSMLACAMILSFGLICKTSQAISFTLVGVDDSNNTADVLMTYNSSLGTLGIDITNTATGTDPRVTGFALNTPLEVTGVSSFTGPSDWAEQYDPGEINTPGSLGFFDLAGLTGHNFNGGHPNDGIPHGILFSFSFTLTGVGLGSLTESSFLTGDPYFVVRFQRTGLDGEGSDVAIPGNPIPEPTTIALLGIGLAGLAGVEVRRRRKKKAVDNS